MKSLSSFSNSKKNRSALIAVCIALFLPLVIAVTYFFTSTDQLVAENIKELTVVAPDGSVSSFDSSDKRVIELYAKMMNTSAVVDKAFFESANLAGTEPYTITYSENNLEHEEIMLYVSADIKECVYITKDKNGVEQYYRVDTSVAKELLQRDEYASSNEAASIPAATLISLDGETVLTPSSYSWDFTALDGSVKSESLEQETDNGLIRLNTDDGGNVFELSFDKTPDVVKVEMVNVENENDIFNDDYEKMSKSVSFDEIYHDKTYSVKVTAEWMQFDSLKYSGTVVYEFDAIYDIAPTYSILNKSLPTGEFTVLTIADFNDGETLRVNADNSLGLPSELKVYDYNGKKITMIPLSHYLEVGEYTLTLTTEHGDEATVTGNIKSKEEYPSQEIYLSSDDEDTLALRAAITKESLSGFTLIVNELTAASENEQLFTGRNFDFPTGRRTVEDGAARFGMKRKVLHKDEGMLDYVSFGMDLVCEEGQDILAANSGKVVFAGETTLLGNTVIVDHGYGILSYYGNLSSISVSVGDEVTKSETAVGKAGNTGFSCRLEGARAVRQVSCHYAVSMNGIFIDPKNINSGITLD